jgi:hypothetical protein
MYHWDNNYFICVITPTIKWPEIYIYLFIYLFILNANHILIFKKGPLWNTINRNRFYSTYVTVPANNISIWCTSNRGTDFTSGADTELSKVSDIPSRNSKSKSFQKWRREFKANVNLNNNNNNNAIWRIVQRYYYYYYYVSTPTSTTTTNNNNNNVAYAYSWSRSECLQVHMKADAKLTN